MKNKYKAMEKMLYSYKGNKYEIRDIDIELEKMKDSFNGVNPMSYEERVSTSRNISSSVEKETIDREEKENKLKDRKAKLHRESRKVENALKLLTTIERTVIENRYFEGKQWWDVCSIVKYSERWVKDTRKEAIEKIIARVHL